MGEVGILGDSFAYQRSVQEQTDGAGPGVDKGLFEELCMIAHR